MEYSGNKLLVQQKPEEYKNELKIIGGLCIRNLNTKDRKNYLFS